MRAGYAIATLLALTLTVGAQTDLRAPKGMLYTQPGAMTAMSNAFSGWIQTLTSSGGSGGYDAWYCFTGVPGAGTHWLCSSTPSWAVLEFTSPRRYDMAHFYFHYAGSYKSTAYTVAGSNPAAGWVTLCATSGATGGGGWERFVLSNVDSYVHYKIASTAYVSDNRFFTIVLSNAAVVGAQCDPLFEGYSFDGTMAARNTDFGSGNGTINTLTYTNSTVRGAQGVYGNGSTFGTLARPLPVTQQHTVIWRLFPMDSTLNRHIMAAGAGFWQGLMVDDATAGAYNFDYSTGAALKRYEFPGLVTGQWNTVVCTMDANGFGSQRFDARVRVGTRETKTQFAGATNALVAQVSPGVWGLNNGSSLSAGIMTEVLWWSRGMSENEIEKAVAGEAQKQHSGNWNMERSRVANVRGQLEE